MIRSIRWSSAAIAAALVMPTVAYGDEGAVDPAAIALFRKGRDQIAAGDWEGGCEKMSLSFARSRTASTLLNLARCDEHEGRLASAWARHQQALPLAERIDDPIRREELLGVARAGIAALEKRVPKLRIDLQKPKHDVTLTDEERRVLPAGEEVPLDPGRHRITARAAGYVDATLDVELAEGRTTMLAITLDPVEVPANAAPAPPSSPVQSPPHESEPFPWLAVGVGAAGVTLGAVGLGFGIDALNASSDLRDRCGSDLVCNEDPSFDPDPLNDRKNRGAVFAAVFGGTGLVTLAVATWMFLHRDSRAQSSKAALVPVRNGAMFTVPF